MSNIAIFPGTTFNLITGATTLGAAISPSFYTQVDSSGGVVINVTATPTGSFSSLQFAIDGSTADSGSVPEQLTIWDAVASPNISLILTPGLFYRLRAISFVGGTAVSVSAIINIAAMALPVAGGGGGGTADVQYLDGATQAAPTGTVALGKNPSNILHAVALDASGNTVVSGTVTANVGTGTQPVSGSVSVSNFPATQPVSIATMPSTPVTGTFFQATQPVSLATAPTTPVTGTFFQATQPVSLATLPALTAGAAVIGHVINDASAAVIGHVIVDTAPTTAVTGTFFQATQPVSLATLPALTAGAAVIGHVIVDTAPSTAVTNAGTFAVQAAATLAAETTKVIGTVNISAAQTIAATESGTWTVQPGNTPNTTPWLVSETPDILAVTAVGASGAAVTATLPAVASQFHYISMVEIVKYAVAALTGGVTPVTVTTTNLPGTPAFTFGTAAAIGTVESKQFIPSSKLRSSVVNTATTIVCPVTTNVIWRVNVWYRAGV